MGKYKTTQHDRVLQYMKDFGSITTFDAYRDLGITKLTTRVSELRANGVRIKGTPEVVENRYGDKCHIHRYTLEEEEEQCILQTLAQ